MIIFIFLVLFGGVMLLLGIRLLSDCGGKMDTDLTDYVWALDALVAGAVLCAEAYYRCPFKLVWV